MNDEIIVEKIEDDRDIGDLHIKANNTGVSFDYVVDDKIKKSCWLTIDDLFEKMQ